MYVLVGRIWGILGTVALSVLSARLLEPADFGRLAVTISVASFGICVAIFGMNSALMRRISEGIGLGHRAYVRKIVTLGAQVAFVTSLLAGVATAISSFYLPLNLKTSWQLAFYLGAFVTLISWQTIAAESLRALQDQKVASILAGGQLGGPLTVTLIIMIFVLCDVFGWKLNERTALGIHVAAVAMTLPIALYYVRKRLTALLADTSSPESRDVEGFLDGPTVTLKGILILCLPLMLIQAFSAVASQADMWIAGEALTEEQVAYYAVARRLMLFISMPTQIATMALAPSIALLRVQGKWTELERLLRVSATAAGIPSVAALFILFAGGSLLISFMFGENYAPAAQLVTILSIGQFAFCFVGAASTMLSQTGHQRIALIAIGISAGLLLTLGGPVAKIYGAEGLAWLSTGLTTVHSLFVWMMAKRYSSLWTHPDLKQIGEVARRIREKISAKRTSLG